MNAYSACPPAHACGLGLQSSTFDRVVDKEGWPTKFEQLVAESQPIAPVFCPVCGAAQQSVKFGGMNVRWVLQVSMGAAESCLQGAEEQAQRFLVVLLVSACLPHLQI